MPPFEPPAPTRRPAGGRHGRLVLRGAATVVTAVALSVTGVAVVGPGPAGADPLADQIQVTQAQAAAIAAQLQADGEHLEVLSQRYDALGEEVRADRAAEARTAAQVGAAQAKVAAARATLRDAALDAYLDGTSTASVEALLDPSSDAAALSTEYHTLAAGDLAGVVTALRDAQEQLQTLESHEQAQQARDEAALAQLAATRQAAMAAQGRLRAEQSQVQGQLATLVARLQAQAEAAAAAAFAAQVAAAQRAAAIRTELVLPPGARPAAPGGAEAVAAAETQLGVPYVWGGESPGTGFDCSGLTQWAWAQVGVDLPRTAQQQYDAVTPVSLADLEPGDLLFWNDGTSSVQHVAMYVGGGQVIQAPYSGTVVSFSAVWTDGLVGAGRP